MIKQELKIHQNIFALNLRPDLKEDSKEVGIVRKLVRKYVFKKDLVKDTIFKQFVAQGLILGVKAKHNLIPTVGRAVLARLLSGDATYSGEINYGALGSGTTAFTNASTILNTEVYRKLASSQAYDDNIAYIDFFIASGDVADQTFEEFGAFIDGTASADTGQAFSLLITGGWVKSGSLFISCKYTIT